MSREHSLESRYRTALESASIGVWTWCAETRDIAWDAQAAAIVGLGDGQRLTLTDWTTLALPRDRDRVQDALAQATSPDGDGRLVIEARFRRPSDGETRWLSVYGHVELRHGVADRVCGAVRDITDSYDIAEETGRVSARLAAVVSIAADAIITLDREQRITLYNDGAERIFGYARDEVIGRPLSMLLPERFRRKHAAHVRQFGGSGDISRGMGERSTIYGLRKNGEEFAAEASISHVEIDGERIFTAVVRDVSEHKRMVDMLSLSRDQLEARVAERTAELKAEMERREETQAQLVRTQRMEAFGQLTGGIAHDFNNLLTVISGNLELMEMRIEDERSRKQLKRAREAAEMGARLTSRLLTFARRRHFSPAPLNLNEQVMSMVDLLRRTLGEDVDLNASLAPKLWTVRADPSEIENAVLNLAINARDAMPRGGQLVIETANVMAEDGQIGTIDRLRAGPYVRLSVSDTGSGMDAEVLSHAFEPFFTTKEPGRGTGLGLSTIYGFARQSCGTATIYSEPGRGTTVTIYLPRTDETPLVLPLDAEGSIPRGKDEVVLVVEDNAEVREITRQRLEDLGYEVIETENGPEALARLESGARIDIVFSDMIMAGGMSGHDVALAVRQRWPEVKLLLTSGYPDDILRKQDVKLQDVRVLRKPYSRRDLATAVRQALDG